jgi:hypothetical protein
VQGVLLHTTVLRHHSRACLTVGWFPFKLVWPSLNCRCYTNFFLPYVFDERTVLFNFRFDEGAIIELHHRSSFQPLAFCWMCLFFHRMFFEPLVFFRGASFFIGGLWNPLHFFRGASFIIGGLLSPLRFLEVLLFLSEVF